MYINCNSSSKNIDMKLYMKEEKAPFNSTEILDVYNKRIFPFQARPETKLSSYRFTTFINLTAN